MNKSMRALSIAAVALLALAPSVQAQVAERALAPEIRVVNNHRYQVRVVLVDAEGRHHSLGRVAVSKARVFTPEATGFAAGPVRVKVFADEPVWSAANTGEAIRSRDMLLPDGEAISIWVEPDLTRSSITVGY